MMRQGRTKSSRLLALLLVFAMLFGLFPLFPTEAEAVTTVTMSPPTLALFINESKDIAIQITDAPTSYTITWTYRAIGTEQLAGLELVGADTSCVVRGVSIGVADVVATVTDTATNQQYEATCRVVVSAREMVTGITLDIYSKTVSVGESFSLVGTAEPSSATDTTILWSIQSSNIAILGAQSTPNKIPLTITAQEPGKTTITARANDGSGSTATFNLTVTAPAEGIIMDSAASVVVGKTLKLAATVTPTTAINKTVVWFSDNDSIASVGYNTGTITGLRVGTCKITAAEESTLVGGQVVPGTTVYKECTLTVTISAVPVISLSFNNNTATVIEKKTTPLVVNINPTNATNKKLYLTSSDITIATVPASVNAGASFNVTGVKPGTVTITAKSDEDSTIFATATVTVIATPGTPVTDITLGTTDATLIVGGTVTPKATLTPSAPTIKTITWSSSDNSVATVDNTGKITATGPGACTIYAAPDGDDPNAPVTPATCAINVVSLNESNLALSQNATYTLNVLHIPANSGLTVAWTTSKTAVATLSTTAGEQTTLTAQGAGEATITATVKRGATVVAKLECLLSVTANVDPINYQIAGNATALFDGNDFKAVCTNATGNTLSYVKFTLPNASVGKLTYLYDKAGETPVAAGNFYYLSGTPKIGDVSFIPSTTFSGKATINYAAVDNKGNTYNGTVSILVGGSVQYSTEINKPVTFAASDFNDFCKLITGGKALKSVRFTLPKTTEGTLYYMYAVDVNDKVLGTKVTATTDYFNTGAPNIDDVTFVPAKDFIGTIEIKFTGRDSDASLLSGTVRISVGQGAGVDSADIEYHIAKNEVLDFVQDDFTDFCKSKTGEDFNYVQLTPPSELRGTLYYNYSPSKGSGSSVTAAKQYYRASSSYLRDVSFVPAENFEGTVEIRFTGLSAGGQAISGIIAILVGDGYGDIRYSAGVNVPIHFDNEAFNVFSKGETDANFDYIQFTLPKDSEGVLYYQYGRSGETALTANTAYRRTAVPRLDEVTFIPAKDFIGVSEFSFSGKSFNGQDLSGTIALTYDPSLTGMPVIHYATEYAPVTFESGDFIEACGKRGGGELVSVTFVLPPGSVGHLYEGFGNHNDRGTPVRADTVYPTGSGTGSISDITFLPRAGTTGSVSIPYYGTDAKGEVFTGYVHISIPMVATSSFGDMDKFSWASASVEYLRSTGVVSGTGANRFGPGDSIIRGDFMLMLYRAFALAPLTSASFPDVPAGSYYAQAIQTGRAMGIALGTADGRFQPGAPLTRQDAMVLIHRMLGALDREVAEASESYLNSFSDGRHVSTYAKAAVADLIYAGIIQGDGQGRLNPLNSVTRAEMAVILHRVLTM